MNKDRVPYQRGARAPIDYSKTGGGAFHQQEMVERDFGGSPFIKVDEDPLPDRKALIEEAQKQLSNTDRTNRKGDK